jgi:16S rRNA (adenine1518-N6/adenine1519-N6)-dimethyltransferase
MQPLSEIRTLLESRGLAPRKSLGQNFLTDHNLIRKLVDASGVQSRDAVLEIGPGTGTLTEELLARGCRVVACELDRGLSALLRERLGTNPNFTLIEGDCLDTKRTINAAAIEALGQGPFRLVANLPYGAATPVMSVLMTSHPNCIGQFVTIQREVADRLAASPGSKDYGTLSVIAQTASLVTIIAKLPPECFWPRPDVTSAMVSLTRLATPRSDNIPALADFCQSLFEKRRKQIGAVLGRDGPWPEGILPTDRAEALSVDQLILLYRSRRPSVPRADS